MSDTSSEIIKITKQLFPTGHAFAFKKGSDAYRLHRALAKSEAMAYDDAAAIMNMLFPDNPYFSADDATEWELKLGLPTNLALPLNIRKEAIKRKMAYPGINPAKGHYLYLQEQLQAAGFNVWVHENIFPLYPTGFENHAPIDEFPFSAFQSEVQFGRFQFGQKNFGKFYNNIVANSIYQEEDEKFDIGNYFSNVFFICGELLGYQATVETSREIEFRQLILELKQVQDIGLLYVQYVTT